MADDPDRITVTKLDAAKRQLRTAIRLWFEGVDPISVHVLAFSAYEIVHTLFKRKGLRGLLFDNARIREEYRSEWAKRIKAAASFFKHAQKDPDAALEFWTPANEILILFSLRGLAEMGEPPELEWSAFSHWYAMQHPELLLESVYENILAAEVIKNLRRMNPRDYFNAFCQLSREY